MQIYRKCSQLETEDKVFVATRSRTIVKHLLISGMKLLVQAILRTTMITCKLSQCDTAWLKSQTDVVAGVGYSSFRS